MTKIKEKRMVPIGFVRGVREFKKFEAIIFGEHTEKLSVGYLLEVVDPRKNTKYLAIIRDIKPEFNPMIPDLEQIARELGRPPDIKELEEIIKTFMGQPSYFLAGALSCECELLAQAQIDDETWDEPRLPPSLPSPIVLPDPDTLKKALQPNDGIYLGKLVYNEDVEVQLDYKKFNQHLAILSQTGAGKTETAKRLIYEFIQKPGCSALVIDPVGQYSGLRSVEPGTISLLSKILRENSICKLITLIILGANKNRLDEIANNLAEKLKKLGISASVIVWDLKDNKVEHIQETEEGKRILICNLCLPKELKFSTLQLIRRGKTEFFDMIVRDAAELLNAETQMGIDLEKVAQQFDNICKDLEEKPYFYHRSSIQSVRRDLRYIRELIGKFDRPNSLIKIIFEENSLTIIDHSEYSGSPLPFIAWLLDEIFEFATKNQGTRLLICLEEAHRYCPSEREELERCETAPIVRKIATEGRKFNLCLCLISQRPSRLDSTTLSQCGTLIILRVRNEYDRKQIESSCESVLESDVKLLPELSTGECIVSGVAVPNQRIPLRVRVEKL